MIMKFRGHGAGGGGGGLVTHFGISQGEAGLKLGNRPCLGMDIFWNCPLLRNSIVRS